jgi:NADPH2:quinone reductase
MSLLRAASPRAGETVLVEAAGGGVGTLLVQLARDAGARVIAAARGAAKLALAAELGADGTVDYGEPEWA